MTEVYAAMDAIAAMNVASASELCRILGASRSAYYAWRRATPTARDRGDAELMPMVREVFHRH